MASRQSAQHEEMAKRWETNYPTTQDNNPLNFTLKICTNIKKKTTPKVTFAFGGSDC
jgi:hypothetical protein